MFRSFTFEFDTIIFFDNDDQLEITFYLLPHVHYYTYTYNESSKSVSLLEFNSKEKEKAGKLCDIAVSSNFFHFGKIK